MPHTTRNAKRAVKNPYGTYDVPSSASIVGRHSQYDLSAEEPLSYSVTSSPDSSIPTQQTSPQEMKALPPAFRIPTCHSSEESCRSATNNCSGRGICYEKYTSNRDGDSSKSVTCFACRCGTTTVRENDSGTKKTIRWAGPACQKKDVSVPFILIAAFTVFIVGMASWGVGLLVSIGNEQLPGVIGAGVVGPRSQK